MKKLSAAVLSLVMATTLSSCSFFDNEARDKAACDRISEIVMKEDGSGLAVDAPAEAIRRLETEALPMASGTFGVEIQNLINAYKNTESQSIFDQFAGGVDALYYVERVFSYCVSLSSNVER